MWLSWCLKRHEPPGLAWSERSLTERTVRRDGEDPFDFAVDMGPNARTRLLRDQFIAGYPDCDLRRHLDSV